MTDVSVHSCLSLTNLFWIFFEQSKMTVELMRVNLTALLHSKNLLPSWRQLCTLYRYRQEILCMSTHSRPKCILSQQPLSLVYFLSTHKIAYNVKHTNFLLAHNTCLPGHSSYFYSNHYWLWLNADSDEKISLHFFIL